MKMMENIVYLTKSPLFFSFLLILMYKDVFMTNQISNVYSNFLTTKIFILSQDILLKDRKMIITRINIFWSFIYQ